MLIHLTSLPDSRDCPHPDLVSVSLLGIDCWPYRCVPPFLTLCVFLESRFRFLCVCVEVLSHLPGPASSFVTNGIFYDIHLENTSLFFFYSTFHLFKITEWQNCKNCKQLTKCLRIKKKSGVNIAVQRHHEKPLLWWMFSVSWLSVSISLLWHCWIVLKISGYEKLSKVYAGFHFIVMFDLHWHQINVCNCG